MASIRWYLRVHVRPVGWSWCMTLFWEAVLSLALTLGTLPPSSSLSSTTLVISMKSYFRGVPPGLHGSRTAHALLGYVVLGCMLVQAGTGKRALVETFVASSSALRGFSRLVQVPRPPGRAFLRRLQLGPLILAGGQDPVLGASPEWPGRPGHCSTSPQSS